MKFNSLFLLLIALIFGFFITPKVVQAHILKTDGTVGAVLHIDPEDDPVVGEQANMFFEIKDTSQKFDPKKCDCQLFVYEGGAQIYNQKLFQDVEPSLTNASASYNFPRKDVYQVVVVGTPLSQQDFQPFKLQYDIRVSRESTTSPVEGTAVAQTSSIGDWISTHVIHLIGIGILVLFLIGAIFKQRFIKRT